MVVAVLAVVGLLVLLFYVIYLVRPKRFRMSARVLRLIEFIVEVDGESVRPRKLEGGAVPAEGGSVDRLLDVPEALHRSEQKALP